MQYIQVDPFRPNKTQDSFAAALELVEDYRVARFRTDPQQMTGWQGLVLTWCPYVAAAQELVEDQEEKQPSTFFYSGHFAEQIWQYYAPELDIN